MQRLVGVCVLSLLVTAGCGGGEEDPILVPATMAPTTAAPATLASTTTTTTLAPTPTTAAPVMSTTTTTAPVASTTTTTVPVASTTAIPTTTEAADVGPLSVLVEVGDSLSKIAKQYDTTVDDLMVANDITDPNLVLVGQELVVSGIVPVVPDVEPPVC